MLTASHCPIAVEGRIAPFHVGGGVPHLGVTASARLRWLLSYWNSKCDGRRMPTRPDIEPTEIAELLSIVFLIGVEAEPRRYRVRVAGSSINHAFGEDHTGWYIDEIGSLSSSLGRFDCLVDTGAPYFARIPHHRLESPLIGYEALALPVSRAGEKRVAFILGGLEFFDESDRIVPCECPTRVW